MTGASPALARGAAGSRAPILIALVAAVAQLIALAVYVPRLLVDITWNSDWVASMVISERLAMSHAPAYIATGVYGFYSTLWFEEATVHLPAHRFIWLAEPAALSILGVALLVYAAARAAGTWAAVLTLVLAIAPSSITLAHLLAPANRQPTWFTMCLLAAFVMLVASARRPGSRRTLVLAAAVGLVVGLNLASDPLMVLVSGVAPMLVAGVIVPVLSRNWRAVVPVALATSVMALVAAVASLVAHRQGITTTGLPGGTSVAFATQQQLGTNLGLLFRGVMENTNGGFLGETVDRWSILQAVCFAAGFGAIAGVLLQAVRVIRAGAANATAANPAAVGMVFWAVCIVMVAAAFTLSRIPEETAEARYLVPAFFVVAAGLPLLTAGAGTRSRFILAAVAVAIAVSSFHAVKFAATRHTAAGLYTYELPALENFLKGHDLTRGYGPYWDSSAISWKSKMAVDIIPYDQCTSGPFGEPSSTTICFHLGMTAVQSRPGRSFVVLDPLWLPDARVPASQFGEPESTYSVGRFTVLVYPDDVGRRVMPPPGRSPFLR